MEEANRGTLRMVKTREHLPPAPIAGPPDCLRPFANERLNSRLTQALPGGTWRVRWRSPLPPAEIFLSILHSKGRTIVLGRSQWLLFNENGRQLKTEASAGEDGEIDGQNSLFYGVNRYSNVAAYHLADGNLQYRFRPAGTSDYARTFVHRSEAEMVVASANRSVNMLTQTPANSAALEVYEFTQPVQMDEDQLTSIEERGVRNYTAAQVWVAVHGPILVAASPNTLEYLDMKLRVRRSFAGAFDPQGISLDETGRLHMLVESEGKQTLWLVSPRGETVPVPLAQSVYQRPPVIGYDHTAYLVGEKQVVAVAEDGQIAWTYASPGRIAGGMALPQDLLLVGAGSAVLALNAKGDSRVVFGFANETLILPPVLTAQGEILVAARGFLACLGPV